MAVMLLIIQVVFLIILTMATIGTIGVGLWALTKLKPTQDTFIFGISIFLIAVGALMGWADSILYQDIFK